MNQLNKNSQDLSTMQSVKEAKKSSKLSLILSAFLLTSLSAPQIQAEDIEIYTGLVGESATFAEQVFKPNLLFVIDTSGSMSFPEAVENPRPAFDPDVDYGNSSDDDVYIYNESRIYTGMFVDGSDNNCLASVERHTEFPAFPEYLDKAVVWERTPGTVVSGGEVCTTNGTATRSDGNTSQGVQEDIDQVFTFQSIQEDRRYTLTIEPGSDAPGLATFRFENSNGTRLNNNITAIANSGCTDVFSIPSSCTIDIPAGSNIASAQVFYLRTGDPTGAQGSSTSLTFVSTEMTCGPIFQQSDPSADWKVTADDSNNIEALECQMDSIDLNDGHGSNRSPTPEIFAQLQDDGENPTLDPNYTSASSNPNRLNWDDNQYVERYLFPGNYHDYLQTPVEDFFTAIQASSISNVSNGQTPFEFCSQGRSSVDPSRNVNQFVRDATGDLFQCRSRMRILKEAVYNLFISLEGVNVGIMRFNATEGGALVTGMLDIDVPGNREKLIETSLSLATGGATPLQETLFEARRYFGGLATGNENAGKRVLEPNRNVELIDGGAGGIRIVNDNGTRIVLVDPENDGTFTDAQFTGNEDDLEPFYNITNDFTDTSTASITDASAVTRSNGVNTYISPIQSECQDNNIIFLSDGEPSEDISNANDIRTFSGLNCPSGTFDSGECLDELAFGLANNDVNADIREVNNVFLNTIGLGSDVSGVNTLINASNQGLRSSNNDGDQHFEAINSNELQNAFQSILRDLVQVQADSFVAPAVSVNAFNRLEFRDDLYFSVFQPNDSPRWNGNIKRYRIDSNGVIVDFNGDPATDDSGFFRDSAESYWSGSPDGSNVTEGGFASNLRTNRTLYASLDESTDVVQLTQGNFLSTILNTNISQVTSIGALGTGDIADTNSNIRANAEEIIAWSFGEDVQAELGGATTDPNFFVAEALHSSPYVLDFGDGDVNGDGVIDDSDSGGTDDVIIALTNQGMVHAIDGANGQERWAYLPDASLFSNLGDYYNNLEGETHTYGLDGQIAFDVERNPVTQNVSKAHIFVGQRRGGSKYFAMNITNADEDDAGDPIEKLWTLENLPRMGQSWATPVVAKVNFCTDPTDEDSCGPREVLVISGGYDTKYDSFETDQGGTILVSDLADNVVGNAIYIVDRNTGSLLWVAGKPGQVDQDPDVANYTNEDMTHSFPTEPTVVDADFDGVADLMFAVDIAGRVWRFDFRGHVIVEDPEGTSNNPVDDVVTFDENDILLGSSVDEDDVNAEVSGGIIAELAVPGVNQRFYNRLDISTTGRTDDDLARYNIVVGSGYRAHPRADEADINRVYFVFDRNLDAPALTANSDGVITGITYNYAEPDVPTTDDRRINSSDLLLVNGGLNSSGPNRHGFSVDLINNSEKMLNPTLTSAGVVFAVSYTPTVDDINADSDILCERDTGSSVLYQIDLFTGETVTINLASDGISSQPVVLEVPDDVGGTIKVLVIGSESFKFDDDENSVGDDEIEGDPDAPELGDLIMNNWWERDRSLIQTEIAIP